MSQTEETTLSVPQISAVESSEVDIWAHERPFAAIQDHQVHNRQDDDPIFDFTFQQVPQKIREAERYYDSCDYDASTGILVKCIKLYDEQYGEGWALQALEQDRPLCELPNLEEILEFARLLKEYALNMILMAKDQNDLNVQVDEDGKPTALQAQDEEEDGADGADDNNPLGVDTASIAASLFGNDDDDDNNNNENNDDNIEAPSTAIGFDSDHDEDDDDDGDDTEENAETYYSLATENLQLAFQIFGRYVVERSTTTPTEEILETRPGPVDEQNNPTTLQYALGNSSNCIIPASDLLPLLWRKEDGVTIKRLEICQVYLGDVYDSLADVHMEEEQWVDAAKYLDLSLKLRRRTEKSYGRGLASIHTKYAAYYALRHQYEYSNQHHNLSASVFAFRSLDKIAWLYDNLKVYNLSTICPNTLGIELPTDTTDASLLLTREQIMSIFTFCQEKLFPAVRQDVYRGQPITTKEVNAAINNIIDYYSIIDSIYNLYEDNLQDIADSKQENQSTGMDIATLSKQQPGTNDTDQNNDTGDNVDEINRVKAMVQEVMRTDELKHSVKSNDINEALGFASIKKTGSLATSLLQNGDQKQQQQQQQQPDADQDESAFVPVVKRKVRPVESKVVAPVEQVNQPTVKKRKVQPVQDETA